MGFKGVCKFLYHRLFELFVIVILILLLPNLPPYTNFSEPFSVKTKPLEGKLALNEKLNDVELWHKGELLGPEAYAEYDGELYASTFEGSIVKLTGNHITPIVQIGKPCKRPYEERICGRPLGMQFDNKGVLYVADAYYGIYQVYVKTGQKVPVITVDQEIGGKKPKIPNSLAIASNGDIFWSDSSSEFLLQDGIFDFLADPSGRLIHYDAKTYTNKILIDKLHFANGVILSENEEFVLVAETFRNRIHRYYLQGSKKGTHDIFIDGLPGLVDNIKPDGKGGFLIALIIAVDKDHPQALQAIGPFPLIRKFVGRVLGLTELLFDVINKVYPCEFAERAIYSIGHFNSAPHVFNPARVTVIRLDKSGQILDSLHSLNKKISHICEAFIFKDTLYLGTPFNDYIARIPLSKIGWQDLAVPRVKREVPVEQTTKQRPTTTTTSPPTTTTTPRPTTTTPRPTTTTTRPTTTTPPPTTTTSPPTTTTPSSTTTPAPTATRPSTNKQTDTKQQAPSQQQTPPPKQQTPLPKQQTPPPKQQTPSPKQHTPPPTKQTPPSKQQTPPPKQQTPPPKQQTPPSKQQTPPPKQQTPPPKQQTPTQQAPSLQTQKQTTPPAAQPVRDQTKSVPIGGKN